MSKKSREKREKIISGEISRFVVTHSCKHQYVDGVCRLCNFTTIHNVIQNIHFNNG